MLQMPRRCPRRRRPRKSNIIFGESRTLFPATWKTSIIPHDLELSNIHQHTWTIAQETTNTGKPSKYVHILQHTRTIMPDEDAAKYYSKPPKHHRKRRIDS